MKTIDFETARRAERGFGGGDCHRYDLGGRLIDPKRSPWTQSGLDGVDLAKIWAALAQDELMF
jgi:hypothetical protein